MWSYGRNKFFHHKINFPRVFFFLNFSTDRKFIPLLYFTSKNGGSLSFPNFFKYFLSENVILDLRPAHSYISATSGPQKESEATTTNSQLQPWQK